MFCHFSPVRPNPAPTTCLAWIVDAEAATLVGIEAKKAVSTVTKSNSDLEFIRVAIFRSVKSLNIVNKDL